MSSFHNIIATFNPKKTDDLIQEAKKWIGTRVEFSYVGSGDEDESYPGQKRYMAIDTDIPYWGWVPEEDLDDIEPINPNGRDWSNMRGRLKSNTNKE